MTTTFDERTQRDTMKTPTPSQLTHTSPSSTLTPYLTLPHLLSLTWLATPILSLLFIVFRLFDSTSSAQAASDDAKHTLLASCQAAQTAATVATNIPSFMAEGVNRNVQKAVNASIDAAKDTMIFALTALAGIIEFLIDIYRSTFLCFLELAIRGSLGVLIAATQEFSDFVTNTLNGLRTSIQNDVQTANNAIQSAVQGVNKLIPSFLNVQLNVPQFDVPSLSGLQNVTLPTTVQDGLTKLNGSIPTLDDIRQSLDNLIETPFNALKTDLNNSFSNIRFTSEALPVPQQQQLSFCDDMDMSVVDDLTRDIIKIARIGCLLLLAVAVLMILGNCAIQWYHWRVLQRRLELVREGWGGDPAAGGSMDMSDRTLLSIFSSLEHPLATTFAQRLTDIFRLSPQKHINVRFFFNYVFYPPALACLLIGVFGILSVELQLIAIGPIQRHYSSVVAAQVNDFSQNIADNVNRDMLAQSTMYANSINTQIDTIQTSVNDGVFGWVNGTVVPLNNTLEAFYTDVQNAVQTVFGGTVLEAPMQEFVRCLIGSKVAALENALTFVQENFQVNVEKVDPQAFMLSDDSVQRATQPIAAAAVGGDSGDGDSQGLVGKLVNRYVESLEKERLMFLIFLGLWGIVVLMALAIIFWHSYGRAVVFRMGKRRHEKRARGVVGGEGVITPWVDQGRREGRESMSSPSGWFDPEKTFATSTNAPQKKIMTFSNIRPSVKEKKQALKPQREVVNLDDPSIERSESVSSDGSRTELTKKAKKRESRKLTADNRRPIREKLIMPDDDPYAVSRARKGSDTGVSVSAFSEDTAYPGSKPSEGGFLSKLSGMFGRRSSEEDDGEVPPPTWRESMARDSWKPRLLSVPKKDVEVMPGQSRASGDWRRDERRNIAAAGATVQSNNNALPVHLAFPQAISDSIPVPPIPSALRPGLQPQPPRNIAPSSSQGAVRQAPTGPRALVPSIAHTRKSSVIDPSLMQGFTEEQKGKPGRKIQSTATIVPPTASTFGGKNPFSTPFDDDYRLGAPGALGVGRAS